MIDTTASEEYSQALRLGQKEYRELVMAGKNPHPAVLDELHPESATDTVVDLGVVEIPTERIVGIKSAGRTTAFTASFRIRHQVDAPVRGPFERYRYHRPHCLL